MAGYGEAGGFALVFDTKRLWDRLKAEQDHYAYSVLYLAEVVYDDEEERFETEFGELKEAIQQVIQTHSESQGNVTSARNVFQPFVNSVTRFEHQGFKEECEFRLTASPLSDALYQTLVRDGDVDPQGQNVKPIHVREKKNVETPYIVINDLPKKGPLPIVKIIVGPQREQKRRAREVSELLGKKQIPVLCSETPFIPM